MSISTSSTKLFPIKIYLAVILIVIDSIANSFIDHLWGSSSTAAVLLLFAINIITHCMLMLLYFTLLWHTFLLKYGLLGDAFRACKSIYLLAFVRLGILLVARIPRVLAATSDDKINTYWDDEFNLFIQAVNTIASIAYYVAFLRAAQVLGRTKFYSAELWHQSLKRVQ